MIKEYEVIAENAVDYETLIVRARNAKEAISMARKRIWLSRHAGKNTWRAFRKAGDLSHDEWQRVGSINITR